MATQPSLIPTWISTYNNAAYTALVAQEAYAYTIDTTYWPTFFQELAAALNTYHTTSRYSDVAGLLSPMFQNYVLGAIYGSDTSVLAQCDGLALFSVDGFLTTVISRPSTYYNDLVLPVIGGTVGGVTTASTPASSVKMAADIATATGAIAAEEATIKSLTSTMVGLSDFIVNYLFQDPPTSNTVVNKLTIAQYFFIDLHYQEVYATFPVSPLTLPPLS